MIHRGDLLLVGYLPFCSLRPRFCRTRWRAHAGPGIWLLERTSPQRAGSAIPKIDLARSDPAICRQGEVGSNAREQCNVVQARAVTHHVELVKMGGRRGVQTNVDTLRMQDKIRQRIVSEALSVEQAGTEHFG